MKNLFVDVERSKPGQPEIMTEDKDRGISVKPKLDDLCKSMYDQPAAESTLSILAHSVMPSR